MSVESTAASPLSVSRRPEKVPVLVWGATATASVALFAVAWPLNTTLYAMPLLTALLLSLASAGAVVLAPASPRSAAALSAVAVVALAAFSSPATGSPWPIAVTTTIAFTATTGLVAALSGWRAAVVGWLAALAGASIVGGLGIHPPASSGAVTADLIVFAAVSGAAILAGLLVRRWQDVREQLVRERRLTAAEQARREVAEERTRLARELHDVVAHGMSAIQVQASSARYRLPDLSEQAAAEFDDLAATARAAMAEMRLLLGVLRSETATAETAPQPGLSDVPALVAAAAGIGDLRLDDELAPGRAAALDPVVSLAGYRIVQEALSNIARHATGADSVVRIRDDAQAVVLDITNAPAPGRPAGAPAPVSGGHGIRGMRERAELLGGSVEATPLPEGGFRVHARLPSVGRRPE